MLPSGCAFMPGTICQIRFACQEFFLIFFALLYYGALMTLYRFVLPDGIIEFCNAADALLHTLDKAPTRKLQAFDERPPAGWRDYEHHSTDAFFNSRHNRRSEGNQ
jgi:hypothetical protein